MKKILVFFTLVFLTTCYPNSALAADSSVKNQGFFRSFFGKITTFFSGDKETYISDKDNRELGESQERLLKLLNKYELAIRVGASGRQVYLNREGIINRIEEFKTGVEGSGLEDEVRSELISEADEILRILNMDLVESPQEKIIPEILSSLDELEVLVFEMSEEDASQILELIGAIRLPAVQDLAYLN